MGDTDYHSAAMRWLYEALQDLFTHQSDVYVASNLLFYFEQGNPRGRRDPDILLAKGVGNHWRRSFRVWEEAALPNVFFEMASQDTWQIDLGEKRHLYARLNIKEYFVFDPEGVFISPVFQGFKTENGISVPMTPADDGSLVSQEIGVRLVPEGSMLRLIDLKTGEAVLTRAERAEQEKRRAEELAAEVERLRGLLARKKKSGK